MKHYVCTACKTTHFTCERCGEKFDVIASRILTRRIEVLCDFCKAKARREKYVMEKEKAGIK